MPKSASSHYNEIAKRNELIKENRLIWFTVSNYFQKKKKKRFGHEIAKKIPYKRSEEAEESKSFPLPF